MPPRLRSRKEVMQSVFSSPSVRQQTVHNGAHNVVNDCLRFTSDEYSGTIARFDTDFAVNGRTFPVIHRYGNP